MIHRILSVGAKRTASRGIWSFYGHVFPGYMYPTWEEICWDPTTYTMSIRDGMHNDPLVTSAARACLWSMIPRSEWMHLWKERFRNPGQQPFPEARNDLLRVFGSPDKWWNEVKDNFVGSSSNLNAYIFGLYLQTPIKNFDAKVVVRIRHPHTWVFSLRHKKDWDKCNTETTMHLSYESTPLKFWARTYQAIKDQLQMIDKEPALVIDTEQLPTGKYSKKLLELGGIPTTEQNLKKANEFFSVRDNSPDLGQNFRNYDGPLPDISECEEIWDYWRSKA